MTYRIIAFLSAPGTATAQAYGTRGGLPPESARMVQLLLDSARYHDPGVTMTLLSDLTTDLGDLDPRVDIARYDLGGAGLMMARTDAQLKFIEAYDFAQPLAFLDTDILVNRPIDFVFRRPFDIAVTVRRKPAAPINGGVILANNIRPDAVRSFFRRLSALYHAKYADKGAWWGDQEALNEIVGTGLAGSGEERLISRGELEYLLLPARRFNYSPHWLAATLALPRRSRHLLHFKSADRKRYMGPFYELHMATRPNFVRRLVRAYSRRPEPTRR